MIEKTRAIALTASLFLSGCGGEATFEEPVANVVMLGSYVGVGDQQQELHFSDRVEIKFKSGKLNKSYKIQNGHVLIRMKNVDDEKRPDLVFSILAGGQSLACPSCAKYGLVSFWQKVG